MARSGPLTATRSIASTARPSPGPSGQMSPPVASGCATRTSTTSTTGFGEHEGHRHHAGAGAARGLVSGWALLYLCCLDPSERQPNGRAGECEPATDAYCPHVAIELRLLSSSADSVGGIWFLSRVSVHGRRLRG